MEGHEEGKRMLYTFVYILRARLVGCLARVVLDKELRFKFAGEDWMVVIIIT